MGKNRQGQVKYKVVSDFYCTHIKKPAKLINFYTLFALLYVYTGKFCLFISSSLICRFAYCPVYKDFHTDTMKYFSFALEAAVGPKVTPASKQIKVESLQSNRKVICKNITF